jgi:hypothetical protein
MPMDSITDTTPSLPVMLAYGLIILLYLVILRLLLNFFQQMSDKHAQRSIIDRSIHAMRTHRVDSSMQAFDPYSIAIAITKGGIATLATAVVIVLLIEKLGFEATVTVLIMVIIVAWTANRWLRSREKVGIVREARKYLQRGGSVGSVIALSVLLAFVLFVLASLR